MQCAAGLERVTSGSIQIGETILTNAPSKTIDRVRRRQAGFIFQQYNLLPMLTVAENVALPLRLRGDRVRKAEVAAAVSTVGLAGLGKRLPSQLSGGQQQRAAIARALLAKPDVIFADEPTGALDQATGKQVLGLLRSAVNDNGHTLVMVTHDSRIAAWADRVIFIVDGQIHSELWQPTAEQISVEFARWEAP